ncbi:MAG: hypothetical protein LRY67_03330 [Gammaproteobacteria bacterium]|nr:hypothetical protein [Gammaproteobacteria bacterium]MCD8524795.1 hypothetical protein [Gammaproteobacteria bacterium]
MEPPVEIFKSHQRDSPIELRLHKLLNSARNEYAQSQNPSSSESLSKKLYQKVEILFDLPKNLNQSKEQLIQAIQIKNNYRFGSYSAWIKHKFGSFLGMKPHYGTLESLLNAIETLKTAESEHKDQHIQTAQFHLKALLKRYPEKDAGMFDDVLLHLDCQKNSTNLLNKEISTKHTEENPGLSVNDRVRQLNGNNNPDSSSTEDDLSTPYPFFPATQGGQYQPIRKNSI